MRKPILITSGEPAGIGPDLIIQLAQTGLPACVVLADSDLLRSRARQLGLALDILPYSQQMDFTAVAPSQVIVQHHPVAAPVKAGQLDVTNVKSVLTSLLYAAEMNMADVFCALVTCPVNKAIINDAGIDFLGHTEFFAQTAGVKRVVMMLANSQLRVALATTHIPLAKVPDHLTQEWLSETLTICLIELQRLYGLAKPRIAVCGLNPHAGEHGHMGTEDTAIISPVISAFQAAGHCVDGPMPADTVFVEAIRSRYDLVLAMYHDQGLPVVKALDFANTVNVTLGLPFVRTSVDHGTALDLAGTGKPDSSSLQAAIALAKQLATG